MICPYFSDCSYCSQYHPDNVDEESCDIFGLPIGDGSPHCKYFSCTVSNCTRSECISYEDELFIMKGI